MIVRHGKTEQAILKILHQHKVMMLDKVLSIGEPDCTRNELLFAVDTPEPQAADRARSKGEHLSTHRQSTGAIMKLGSQPTVPWTYLASPTVTQTYHSSHGEGLENVGISNPDRVVRLHHVSENLRSADFRHFPHTRHSNLPGTMRSGNPKYGSGEHFLPFPYSNQRGRILCETRHGPLIATALHLPLLPGPSLISMRIYV